MALDPAPNNKKVIAGATLEKMKKLINIDITLNHNEEHHKGHSINEPATFFLLLYSL